MSVFVPPEHVSYDAYVEYLAGVEAQAIHGAGHWLNDVVAWAEGKAETHGAQLPWSKTHADFSMRPDEVTIWGGYRGHMKSFVTGQIAAWLARDYRVGIASFEMPPKDTLARMIQQCAGCKPSPAYCFDWIDCMDPMLRIYDECTAMRPEKVMAVVHHMAYELGCSHVFIDSLMKCGIATDDYTGQKAFVEQLTLAAKRYHVHIHLIAHLRKPAHKGGGLPNSDDVSGGSDITNLADNVVIIWNDKELMGLKKKHADGLRPTPDELERLDSPTHILKLDKHRRGPDQIHWLFWMDERSTQFLPDSTGRRMEWLPHGFSMAKLKSDIQLVTVEVTA